MASPHGTHLKYERPIETESNTANTLVKRDADGNFEAGAITASLVGNAATATRLANARLSLWVATCLVLLSLMDPLTSPLLPN